MEDPGYLDHALVIIFAIGFPLINGPIYMRRKPAMLAGNSRVRRREYIETIVWLAMMGVASIAVWLLAGRDFRDLGLTLGGSWQTAASVTAVLLVSGLLFAQARGVSRDEATRKATRKALESVKEYFPTSPAERSLFRGVSFAAGIGEEIYYRGFLIWYLSGFLPVIGAVALSSILFGFAHAMHGIQATIRSTLMGMVLAALYLFSGSLWASILFHIAVDLSSGAAGSAAFDERSRTATNSRFS